MTSTLPTPEAPNTPTVSGQGEPKIHLYTAGTPNGYKASIGLEELRLAYPEKAKNELSYDVIYLHFAKQEQKLPEFLKINPNGRIPAIVDDNYSSKNVFETGSILVWLADQYDTEHKLSPADPLLRADMMSWLFFAIGGIGPMQGQAGFFQGQAYKDAFAIRRYVLETERLFSVVEDGLKAGGGEYLVGGKYSFADLNAWTWMSMHGRTGIDVSGFPLVRKWIDRIAERQGVKQGLEVPTPRSLPNDEEIKQKLDQVKEYIKEGDKIVADAEKK